MEAACRKSLEDLGLDYLDLYLIHFPISLKFVPFDVRYPPEWIYDPSAEEKRMEFQPVSVRDTWAAMESLVDKGLVRNIGLSNWNCQGLRDVHTYARIKPASYENILFLYLRKRNFNIIKSSPNRERQVGGRYLALTRHYDWTFRSSSESPLRPDWLLWTSGQTFI